MKKKSNKKIIKKTSTLNHKYDEKYDKLKTAIYNEYKSFIYQLLFLVFSLCIIMSIALYVLTINKNLLASFFLLAIIPIFAFCTLNKITKKYKEKMNYILRDIPRKKRKNYYPKRKFNKFINKKLHIVSFLQKHPENIVHNTTIISIIFVIDLLIPKLFPKYIWAIIISYFILLIITALITTKIENKKNKQTNLIINIIFLLSFSALSLIFCIFVGSTNDFKECLKDMLEICNLIYCAFGMLVACSNSQN